MWNESQVPMDQPGTKLSTIRQAFPSRCDCFGEQGVVMNVPCDKEESTFTLWLEAGFEGTWRDSEAFTWECWHVDAWTKVRQQARSQAPGENTSNDSQTFPNCGIDFSWNIAGQGCTHSHESKQNNADLMKTIRSLFRKQLPLRNTFWNGGQKQFT